MNEALWMGWRKSVKKNKFIWSDGWCIEDGMAWFVDGRRNILYCLDLITGECKYTAEIPYGDRGTFRSAPRVLKVGNEIFCMPDIGTDIWIYDIKASEFSHLSVNNSDGVRVSCISFWQYDNKIFTLATGLNQIIEINICEKTIDDYYPIIDTPKEKLGRSVKVGSDIYVVSTLSNKVYQFNLDLKTPVIHILPGVEDGLYTICFDGTKFWLSGYRKEIYVWDKERNNVETLCDFPDDFGEYDFAGKEEAILNCERAKYDVTAFIESIVIGNYVWFIPFKTNKIIYIDRDTYKMQIFKMRNEDENRDSLTINAMAHKYLVQYVSDERYLGLFSLKNDWLVEIDTKEFEVEVKNFSIDYEKYADGLKEYVFWDNNETDFDVFLYLMVAGKKKGNVMKKEVGKRIHDQICYGQI